MNEINDTPILEGNKPTAEDEFYVEWGRETVKNNITLANDLLRQFLTINVTLLGGSIVFLKPELISVSFRNCALVMFSLSFIVCLFGIVPLESNIDIRKPGDVRVHKENAFRRKRWLFWGAAIFLALGIASTAVGVRAR